MRQPSRPLIAAFALAVFSFLLLPQLFPSWRLCYLVPPIVILLYKRPLIPTLWVAFGSGLLIDLLGSDGRFGLYALTYTLTTAALYPQKKHFFEDSLSTLPLLTFLFSIISTILLVLLKQGFGEKISLSGGWILTDLFFMPTADALYALIAFTLPGIFMPKKPKHEFFLNS